MEETLKLILPDKFSKALVNLPEQGMGYQLVDVLLKDGKWLKKKFVIDSHILVIGKAEEIKVDQIDLIKIHF